jgi:hypothetical protein
MVIIHLRNDDAIKGVIDGVLSDVIEHLHKSIWVSDEVARQRLLFIGFRHTVQDCVQLFQFSILDHMIENV